jgi:hypothetical protein
VGIYNNKAYNFTTTSQISTQDSYALSINNADTVVGIEAYTGGIISPSSSTPVANITLSNFESYAYSINDAGTNRSAIEKDIACIFDPPQQSKHNTRHTLRHLQPATANSDRMGQIVGFAQDDSGNPAACLFDSTGNKNNINLNDLINPTHGWNLRYAYDINDDGWIVGVGLLNGVENSVSAQSDFQNRQRSRFSV